MNIVLDRYILKKAKEYYLLAQGYGNEDAKEALEELG